VFAGARDAGPPDYEKLTAKCQELLHDIGGMGKDFKLHQWEDLLAPKPPPAPPAPKQGSGNPAETSANDQKKADAPTENPAPAASPVTPPAPEPGKTAA